MRFVYALGAAALLCLPGVGSRTQATGSTGEIVVINLSDTVQQVSEEYVVRGLSYAAAHKARAVVLELNTPGGLDISMRSIIQAILVSPVPVIGYVAPSGARAASAGFFILMSCNVAAMSPGTNTGAAHPVVIGQEPDKIEAAKMQNDAAAFMRSIAEQRHRNVVLAEKGVVDSQSFTEQEALNGHLIDLISPTLNDLLVSLDGRSVVVANGATDILHLSSAARTDFQMSLRERVLDMDASLAFLLLALGGLLIFLEFSHPGGVVPGVAGVVLVAVGLFSLSLLPIRWAGAGLLLLALVLFVLEAKFPSHGVLALGGVAAMAFGGVMLVDSPVPEMRVAQSTAVAVAVGFGFVSILLLRLVMRARRGRVVTGAQGLIGEIGTAHSALGTGIEAGGTVLLHGEIWHAYAAAPLAAQATVRVRAVHGLRLEVEPVAPDTGSA